MIVLKIIAFLGGMALVGYTVQSAVRSFVLPRGLPDRVTGAVFQVSRQVFDVFVKRASSYSQCDRVMAFYAPSTLLLLPLIWITIAIVGYSAMFWATGSANVRTAFTLSGSSILTLGFATGTTLPQTILSFSEAAIGLLLLTLLIAYLPTMYSAWSERESGVALLNVWAGPTASPIRLLLQYSSIGEHDQHSQFWFMWMQWFARLAEFHTSLVPVVFFRSTKSNRSWITAAGALLDMASLVASTLDLPPNAYAEVTIRAGYLALHQIADLFNLPYDPSPQPSAPISVSREQFDRGCAVLLEAGIELKPDRELAWKNFMGWRVNYDGPLRELARLIVVPEDQWFPPGLGPHL